MNLFVDSSPAFALSDCSPFYSEPQNVAFVVFLINLENIVVDFVNPLELSFLLLKLLLSFARQTLETV